MKNLLLLFTILFPTILKAQSFVFCPQIETEENQGFENISVNIIFLDSRTYSKKPKEKCTKADIFQEFTQCIRRTYPKMQLTLLGESDFYKEPLDANITIKVKLTKYDATFKTGTYNSSTKYDVQLYLSTKSDSLIEQNFEGSGKAFNSIGYGNAKSASNKSFKEAFDKFIVLLESIKSLDLSYTSSGSINQTNNTSKSDRLRELKQLFDEGVLTQEEFEKEKLKILEEKERK